MAYSPTTEAVHPLQSLVRGLESSLDETAGVDPMYLTPEEKAELLLRLDRAQSRLADLYLRTLAASGDLAAQTAHRNPAAWLTTHTLSDSKVNHAIWRLAEDLQKWQQVQAAHAEGRASTAQAKVVLRALNDLGDGVEPRWKQLAEAELVRLCEKLTPKQLKRAGAAILEMIAPHIAEDAERKKFEAAERRARAETRVDFKNRGDGTVDIHARVPESIATRLKTYLDAFTSPRHRASAPGEGMDDPATGKYLPLNRLRGRAFCALLEAMDPSRMPLQGGDATTVVVTIDLKDLMAGTGVATLNDGTPISAGEARRLACQAQIIPAVLGTDSEVLDYGRSSRFFKRAQRRALRVKYPTCGTQGCTIPAEWCEAHHLGQPWAQGGRTDLKDGILLCPFHHHIADDPAHWQVELLPDGNIRFHRRT